MFFFSAELERVRHEEYLRQVEKERALSDTEELRSSFEVASGGLGFDMVASWPQFKASGSGVSSNRSGDDDIETETASKVEKESDDLETEHIQEAHGGMKTSNSPETCADGVVTSARSRSKGAELTHLVGDWDEVSVGGVLPKSEDVSPMTASSSLPSRTATSLRDDAKVDAARALLTSSEKHDVSVLAERTSNSEPDSDTVSANKTSSSGPVSAKEISASVFADRTNSSNSSASEPNSSSNSSPSEPGSSFSSSPLEPGSSFSSSPSEPGEGGDSADIDDPEFQENPEVVRKRTRYKYMQDPLSRHLKDMHFSKTPRGTFFEARKVLYARLKKLVRSIDPRARVTAFGSAFTPIDSIGGCVSH